MRETNEVVEQFTIYFDRANDLVFMNLTWDETIITVPLTKTEEAPVALLHPN
ncbi:hypothetical protein LZ575_08855 [Antarcticibacterium sp. 1MA-6-2]|uniref:hypothetical protein n=1 Tax=Antarcticibacterium sp. 1MA-6-2 TaxID=2908210 RepID=UPI001F40ABE8|nr:hypothetical protein [Antarcticibacterium sp. 1MA-6-2]UJH92569.1 hypothetical protein LZ575_08855 [Antarcticibacterium sp. 1MA-6-2]